MKAIMETLGTESGEPESGDREEKIVKGVKDWVRSLECKYTNGEMNLCNGVWHGKEEQE